MSETVASSEDLYDFFVREVVVKIRDENVHQYCVTGMAVLENAEHRCDFFRRNYRTRKLYSSMLAEAELVVDADIRKHSRLSNVQDWSRRTLILGSLHTRVCSFPLTVDPAVSVVVFLVL